MMSAFNLKVHDLLIAIGVLVIAAAAGSNQPQESPSNQGTRSPPGEQRTAQPQEPVKPPPAPFCAVPCAMVHGRGRVPMYGSASSSGESRPLRPGTIVETLSVDGRWTEVRNSTGARGFVESKRLIKGTPASDAVALYRTHQRGGVMEEVRAPRPVVLYADQRLKRVVTTVKASELVMVLLTEGAQVIAAVDDGHGGRVIGRAPASRLQPENATPPAVTEEPVEDPPDDFESASSDDALAVDAAELLASGQKAYVARDYATAIELAEKVLALEPRNTKARRLAALAACDNGDRGAGMRHARRLPEAQRDKVLKACGGEEAAPLDCAASPLDPRCAQ